MNSYLAYIIDAVFRHGRGVNNADYETHLYEEVLFKQVIYMNVKSQLMSIWKNTFNDTDEYVNIVFNNYYNDESHFYTCKNDKVVSAMLCIPYCIENINCKYYKGYNSLKVAYQCGVATLPEYRNMGIMSELISRANNILLEQGYALSVLIPSSDYNKLYYTHFDYTPITFISTERFVSEHVFTKNLLLNKKNDNIFNVIYDDNKYGVIYSVNDILQSRYNIGLNILSDNDFIANISKDDIHNAKLEKFKDNNLHNFLLTIYSWFRELSRYIDGCFIGHTFKDFCAILNENLVSGGKILFLTDNNSKPLGMLFCCNIGEDEVTVQLLVSESEESDVILLQSLKSFISKGAKLILRRYPISSLLKTNPECSTQGRSVTGVGLSHHCSLGSSVTTELPDYGKYTIVPDQNANNNELARVAEVSSHAKLLQPYAMAKILKVAEVLKFVALLNRDAEFAILINRDEFIENQGLFVVKDGKLQFTPLTEMSDETYIRAIRKCSTDLHWFNISVAELSALLFRNVPNDAVVDEAISIPRLSINVALMLD